MSCLPSSLQVSKSSSDGVSLTIRPSPFTRTAPSAFARSSQFRIHSPSPQPRTKQCDSLSAQCTFNCSEERFEFGFFQNFISHCRTAKCNSVIIGNIACKIGYAEQFCTCSFCDCICHLFGITGTTPINYCCLHVHFLLKKFSVPDRDHSPDSADCTEMLCNDHSFQKYALPVRHGDIPSNICKARNFCLCFP